jgi:cytochrome c oxidase cbb3-type subunit III
MKLNKTALLFTQIPGYIFAQAKDSAFPEGYYNTMALIILLLVVSIFIAFLYYGTGEGKKYPQRSRKKISEMSFINRFITGTVALEKEKDILLNDDYDGIKELDNRVPPWFNYLFYGSIVFAVIYMLVYHVFETGKLQVAEYTEEIELARLQQEQLAKSGAFITEETVTFVRDSDAIEKGKQLYTTHCVACHAADGGGLIGPNLTDDYWIHGGGIKNVFKVVKYGVPAKGMIPWQTQLNPSEIQSVSSFILTLKGTDPQNPKQPEGELYKEQDSLKTLSSL